MAEHQRPGELRPRPVSDLRAVADEHGAHRDQAGAAVGARPGRIGDAPEGMTKWGPGACHAMTYIDVGQPRNARIELERALQLNPAFTGADRARAALGALPRQ